MSPHGIVHQQRFRSIIDDICEELLQQFIVGGTATSALEPPSPLRIPVSTSPAALSLVSSLPYPQSREESGGTERAPTTPATSRERRMSQVSLARSSASTPSLRARDGLLPPHLRTDNGGNVRVVVRVRAFLPRGMFLSLQYNIRLYHHIYLRSQFYKNKGSLEFTVHIFAYRGKG